VPAGVPGQLESIRMDLAKLQGVVNAMDEMLWDVVRFRTDSLDTRLSAMETRHGDLDELTDNIKNYNMIQHDVAMLMGKVTELSDRIDSITQLDRTDGDLGQRLRHVERELREMTDRNERLEARLTQLENPSATSASAGSWWAGTWEEH
jgi:predicted RNase H-like nuclease (RuvC/YqgF family)